MEDFFATGIVAVDEFNKTCWNKGEGYKIPAFQLMQDKLEGLENGFYIFAGESNCGKSAIMMNTLLDIATCEENNLFGIYVSLDDSQEDIMARTVAMRMGLPISVCSKPKLWEKRIENGDPDSVHIKEMLQLREEGLDYMKSIAHRFQIIDETKVKNAEQLYDLLKKIQMYLAAKDPDIKMIVAIDSLSDIRFADEKLKPGKELNDHIAKTVKSWAVTDFKIPIFGSVHLRKLNNNRRPTMDDLKESGEYSYEASLVWLVHNDVSKNKQIANIYYNEEGSEEKLPIIELDWAKNKKSSFKGRTYYYFAPGRSVLEECPIEAVKRYDSLVYAA